MGVIIQAANPSDYPAIIALIQELAGTIDEVSPATEAYLHTYLRHPGSHILLAKLEEQTVGLLNYSIRPNLYHAGNSCFIEDFVVTAAARGRGIGTALMKVLVQQAEEGQCVEIGVATENRDSLRFYHSFGLVDQSIFLEKHNY